MANTDKIESIPLALELATSVINDSVTQFEDYARNRLAAYSGSAQPSEDVIELILVLLAMTGFAIEQWAEDTERSPLEIVQAMALAYAVLDTTSE